MAKVQFLENQDLGEDFKPVVTPEPGSFLWSKNKQGKNTLYFCYTLDEGWVQVGSGADWNQTTNTESDYIKNKPTKTSDFINNGEGDTPFDPFAKASDLPTKTSDLINDGNGGSPLNPFVTADVLSKSIICNTSVPSLDIFDMVVPKDARTITVKLSRTIMTNIFNGDGSYQRNGNNPGLNIPSRRMVEYNGYIYWVGGENDINIYRTPTIGIQSKTIWKTLDSTKFTSTFSIVWISGYLVVAGNASHLAFISLSTGEITYTQLNETDTKYYWVGLDAVEQNTWAISTGWGNWNTLAVMTSDGLKQITPLKIYGFKFIDDVLWITHQGGFGIGTYSFGLSKLDLNNLEQGFVNVLDFGGDSKYANSYTIGKFPINFFIEEMCNALYIVSYSGYLHISKDGGDTWNIYKLSTYGTYPVTKLMTRSDGRAYYCYEPSSSSCALMEITGLNGDTFTTTQIWSINATSSNYLFPVPVQNGISFNYLYKEYMGQNRYSDTALYYYDFNYYSKYKSILNQNGSYDSNKYIIIENLNTSGYTYYNVLCKVTSAYTSSFSLELYSGPNEILLIVDSPTWPRNNGNVGFYSAKKNQYAGTEWSFDLLNGEAEAISERTLHLKQDALGFTPENSANKKTTLADNSDTYYPTQKAVKTAVDAKADDTKVAAIQGLIPTLASPTNQLADKDFVNSSIGTSTAMFRGTFTSVDNLPTTGVDNNDYAFVKIFDPIQTAEVLRYDRYKWSDGWSFEYSLNNSSFTAAQWDAINSNATASIISDLLSHASNISNPHAVTKSQVGLGDVDNTSDLNKPLSTAAVAEFATKQDALGFTPENVANKKTTLDDNSDTYYPTQKAVKTAVDAKVEGPNSSVANTLPAFADETGKLLKGDTGVSIVNSEIIAGGVNINSAIAGIPTQISNALTLLDGELAFIFRES